MKKLSLVVILCFILSSVVHADDNTITEQLPYSEAYLAVITGKCKEVLCSDIPGKSGTWVVYLEKEETVWIKSSAPQPKNKKSKTNGCPCDCGKCNCGVQRDEGREVSGPLSNSDVNTPTLTVVCGKNGCQLVGSGISNGTISSMNHTGQEYVCGSTGCQPVKFRKRR